MIRSSGQPEGNCQKTTSTIKKTKMKLPFLSVLMSYILLLVISTITYAASVTMKQAEAAAKTFVTLRYPTSDLAKAQTRTTTGASAMRIQEVVPLQTEDKGTLLGYVARLEPMGYILLTADDRAPPVKLYSDDGSFEKLPSGFKSVIETELLEDLTYLSVSAEQDTPYCEQWNALLEPEGNLNILGDISTSAAGTFILTTTWDQDWPYNYYCPSASGGPNGRAYAGCTATAMGQILRYYNQPVAVAANHTYTDSLGSCVGTHSISDAGMGNYDWPNMPTSISNSSPVAQIKAVGQLIYHCAVALDSNFEGGGTSAYPSDVPSVIQTYFGYTSGPLEEKSGYTATQWYNKIAVDIDTSRPTFYGMWEADGTDGHAVVCDGYRNSNEIHLNLGWSGAGDWYNIDSVIAGGYTWTIHVAVFGITPTNNPPSTPSLVSPADGATSVSLTPTLQASAFSDPDGDFHANSQWQVSLNSGFSGFMNMAWDSGENYSPSTQAIVPSSYLKFYNTTYWWRVRYKDNRGAWSSWASPPWSFTTGKVIYVDADRPTGGNGQSWGTAYKYLQDGLYSALSGDAIWVAQGTYRPDEDTAHPDGNDSRFATFQLKNGVAIYGGYAGYGAADPNKRDVELCKTILSGDIGVSGNNNDNSYHVVTGSGTNTTTAVLDGFTITAGNANSSNPYNCGAGMYNSSGSPTVTNCTFSSNSAYYFGGGMFNLESSPTVTNCTFSGNSADSGGGMSGGGMFNLKGSPTVTNCTFIGNCAGYGGGMVNWQESNPTVTNCTFSDNSANYAGGGMVNYYESSPTVTNCTFSGNSAAVCGGMYNTDESSPTVTNCTFSSNSADYGGGMCNDNGSNPTVTNCTFSGNSAGVGGGGMCNVDGGSPTVTNCTFSGNSANEYGGGMLSDYKSSTTLTNCILWGNTASQGNEIALLESSIIDVSYCDVKGGKPDVYVDGSSTLNWGVVGNITDDPLFVDADGRLQAGSPCLDAGDNEAVPAGVTTDLDGNRRIVDGDGDIEVSGPDTKLLLHLDGADGAISTVDSSSQNHAPINFFDNAQLDTAYKYNGSTSLLLDGSGDYLTIPDSTGADWDICGSNMDNWIIDFWVKMTDHTGTECFITQCENTDNRWCILHTDGGGIQFLMMSNGSTAINAPATAAGEIKDTNWHHIALCKVGSLYAIYKDGIKVTSTDDTSMDTFNAPLTIGGSVYSTRHDLAGHLDDIRITHSNILGDISATVDMGAYELWDSDGDGIEEGIDTKPTIPSNDFIDVPKLSGTITTRGDQILTITDEPEPEGVRIKADASGGAIPATVSVGGGAKIYTVDTREGYDDYLVNPTGSIETTVINGIIEITLVPIAGPVATTSLAAGNSLTFDETTFTVTVPLTNPDIVVVVIDGEEFYLVPGESITFNQPPVANAGPDQMVYAWIDGIADVNLDGSDSNDPDGNELTYYWSWVIDGNTYEANGVKPTIELPVGQYVISLIVNDGLIDSEPNEVNITVVGLIEANLCVMPKVLNSKSFMPRIMATLRLPKGITKEQIDLNEPILLYPGEIEADKVWISKEFNNKCRAWNTTIFASFDANELMSAIDGNGQVELVVVGQLKTGQYFFGSDNVTVICPGHWPWHRPWCGHRWNRWCRRPFNFRH